MSRIQDILAKAERDGTAGRITPVDIPPPPPVTRPVAAPPPSFDGTSALRTNYAPQANHAPALDEPAPLRTAEATLHPALVAAIAPHSAVAERYRGIRSRLAQHEESGQLRALLVTSPAAGDGKSVTAANLALTMAQEFQRQVLLVDTDLRGSAIHELFGLERSPGLAEVLNGAVSLDDALVHLPGHGLTILPAGDTPAFPAELLGSTAMRRLVDTLRNRFDRIVLDTPAVAPLADAGTLAPLADGVLMVVRAGITRRPALDYALTLFDEQKVLGVVLNDKN
jgi:capsular exopolysaccharide synthesis family protein